MTPRRVTDAGRALGTSIPTREAPGIGASMRRLGAAKASARSLSRATMLSTLTRVLSSLLSCEASPSAFFPFACRDRLTQPGTSPNMVTTGPIFTSATFTSMPYSLRVVSMRPEVFSWSMPGSCASAGASVRSETGGSFQSSRVIPPRNCRLSGCAPISWADLTG